MRTKSANRTSAMEKRANRTTAAQKRARTSSTEMEASSKMGKTTSRAKTSRSKTSRCKNCGK